MFIGVLYVLLVVVRYGKVWCVIFVLFKIVLFFWWMKIFVVFVVRMVVLFILEVGLIVLIVCVRVMDCDNIMVINVKW